MPLDTPPNHDEAIRLTEAWTDIADNIDFVVTKGGKDILANRAAVQNEFDNVGTDIFSCSRAAEWLEALKKSVEDYEIPVRTSDEFLDEAYFGLAKVIASIEVLAMQVLLQKK